MAIHVMDVGGSEKHRYVVDASTDKAIGVRVSSDTINRTNILPAKIEFGSGSAAVDTNLYRSAADKLATDDAFGVASGTSGAPGLFMVSDTDLGLYRYAANTLSVAGGGAELARVSSAGIGITADGTSGAPGFYWTEDSDMGLYRYAANSLSVAAGGAEIARFTSAGIGNVISGSASAPSYSWTSDSNTGVYPSAADTVSVAGGGSEVARFSSTGVGCVATGNSGAPGFYFTSDADLGIYRVGANQLGVAGNAGQVAQFEPAAASAACGLSYVHAYIAGSASMRAVTIGAADSGGTGYRALVVIN